MPQTAESILEAVMQARQDRRLSPSEMAGHGSQRRSGSGAFQPVGGGLRAARGPRSPSTADVPMHVVVKRSLRPNEAPSPPPPPHDSPPSPALTIEAAASPPPASGSPPPASPSQLLQSSPPGPTLSATPSDSALLARGAGGEPALGRPASAAGLVTVAEALPRPAKGARPATAGRPLGSLRSAAAEAVIQPVYMSHSATLDVHRRLSKENRALTRQFAAALAELQSLRDARSDLAGRLQASEEELRAARAQLQEAEEAGRRAASVRAAVAEVSAAIAQQRADVVEKFGPDAADGLIEAVKEGQLADLMDLLRDGAHPDVYGFNHKTALHHAAREGRLACAVALLHAGASVNPVDSNNRTPLEEARRNRHGELARVLEDYGGVTFAELEAEAVQSGGRLRVEAGPVEQLHAAAAANEPDRIRQLVDSGVDPSAPDLSQCTPLHRAAGAGHVEACDALLRLNAGVNAVDARRRTPLGEALEKNHADVAKLLRARGARTWEELARGSVRRTPGGANRTPAALNASTPSFPSLPPPSPVPPTPAPDAPAAPAGGASGGRERLHGLSVEIPETPAAAAPPRRASLVDAIADDAAAADALCRAAADGDAARILELVARGCSPDTPNYDLRTALHVAAAEGRGAAVAALLDVGADPAALDRWERTPVDEATHAQQEEIARTLRLRGGKTGAEILRKSATTPTGVGIASATMIAKLKDGVAGRRLNEKTDAFVEVFMDAVAGGAPDLRAAGRGPAGRSPVPPPDAKEAAAAARERLTRAIEGGVGERPVSALAERLAVFLQAVGEAAGAEDVRGFTERFEGGLRALLVAESATLFHAAVGRQSFCAKFSPPEQAAVMVPLGKGIVGSVAQAGGLAHPERVEGDPRYSPEFDDYAGGARKAHTMLCCAVLLPAAREGAAEAGAEPAAAGEAGGHEGAGPRVEAVVRVLNKRGGRGAAFSRADASLLSAACALAGPLLARQHRLARFHDALAAAWRTFDVASQCQLYPRSAFEALDRFMGRRLRNVLQCDRLLLLLADSLDRESVTKLYDVLGRRTAAGAPPPSFDLVERIIGRVYTSGVEMAVSDAPTDRRFSPKGDNYLAADGGTVRTLLAVPIRIRSHVLGVYLALNKEPEGAVFSDADASILAQAGAFCVQFLASRAQEATSGATPHPVFARAITCAAQIVLNVEQER